MTAFQCSSLASTTAQDSSGLSGPVPAVKEAPAIAMVGSRPGWRMMRASQAARGVATASTLALPPPCPGPHGWRWISTDEAACGAPSSAPRAKSQSDSPRQQASTQAATAVIRPFRRTPIA